MISIEVGIDLDEVAFQMANSMSNEEILAFVVYLDNEIADLDFTRELAVRLNRIVRAEEENESV